VLAIAAAFSLVAGSSRAEETTSVQIAIKNHQFQPSEISGPANTRITLRVRNLDPTPMEFESVALRVEKVIAANGEGVISLRPLAPGRYSFFDDFHRDARGALVIR
jgi:hypothetical protein